MLDTVPVNVVMRTNGLSEFGRNNESWSVGCGTTGKEHYPSASVGEGGLLSVILHLPKPKLTSKRETATPRATPVHLKALLSCSTGQGSLCNPSRMLVNWNSHSCTCIKNLLAAGAGMGCPGRGAARLLGLRPSMSAICLGWYSLDPRKT